MVSCGISHRLEPPAQTAPPPDLILIALWQHYDDVNPAPLSNMASTSFSSCFGSTTTVLLWHHYPHHHNHILLALRLHHHHHGRTVLAGMQTGRPGRCPELWPRRGPGLTGGDTTLAAVLQSPPAATTTPSARTSQSSMIKAQAARAFAPPLHAVRPGIAFPTASYWGGDGGQQGGRSNGHRCSTRALTVLTSGDTSTAISSRRRHGLHARRGHNLEHRCRTIIKIMIMMTIMTMVMGANTAERGQIDRRRKVKWLTARVATASVAEPPPVT